jgi:hypothetical protein
MPPESHRETLRGFVERADGDLDRASVLAGGWWRDNQRTTTDAEEFFDSLEREFEVTSTASQGIREVVNDAFYAAGREEEGFEARLRERIDPRENPAFVKKVDEELVRPFRRAIIRVLMEEASIGKREKAGLRSRPRDMRRRSRLYEDKMTAESRRMNRAG